MKKIVLTASVVSALILNASAQSTVSMVRTAPKTTFGIHGGVNFFNITGKSADGGDVSNDVVTGFSGGVNAEIPLGAGAYLQPGVDFTRKGAENGNNKVTLNYIDIPVTFIYKPILGRGNLVLGAGPYVGIGVGGKSKFSNSGNTAAIEQDVVFTNDYNTNTPSVPQFSKLDAGANFLAGYEFANKVSLNLKAQLGLKKINPETNNSNDETSLKNTGFGLSVGYRF
ncbi:MAG: hypothetical protein JWR72_2680 [Flavisolibacter sp.]|jgi:hypothetical protein|nr:hypothetical protein [Flavisolibacter sp.]